MESRIRALVEAQLDEGWALRDVQARGRSATLDLTSPHGPLTLVLRPLPAPDAFAKGQELGLVAHGWSPTDKGIPVAVRRRALLIGKALLDAEAELADADAVPAVTRRSALWLLPAALGAFALSQAPLEWLFPLHWALLAGVAYVALSALLGERFPFSRYAAYARTATRTEGSALSVTADGAPVRLSDLTEFAGFDLQALERLANRSSQAWEVHELRRWLADHEGSGGPVTVEVLVHRIVAGPDGFDEQTTVAARGTARRA